MIDTLVEHELTRNPLGHGSVPVDLSSRFTHHFEKTLDCIRYTVDRFQTLTHGPINCGPGKCELKTTNVNPKRGTGARGEILTLTATTRAPFHSPLANAAFAHSLNKGVGAHESKVGRGIGAALCCAVLAATSPSLSGVERYLWVDSVEKFSNAPPPNWLNINAPEIHLMRGPLI